jgi:hypothetical protein
VTAVILVACAKGIPKVSADDPVKATGMTGISGNRVPRLCEEIDDKLRPFLDCPRRGDGPASGSALPGSGSGAKG